MVPCILKIVRVLCILNRSCSTCHKTLCLFRYRRLGLHHHFHPDDDLLPQGIVIGVILKIGSANAARVISFIGFSPGTFYFFIHEAVSEVSASPPCRVLRPRNCRHIPGDSVCRSLHRDRCSCNTGSGDLNPDSRHLIRVWVSGHLQNRSQGNF
jgi:hypothetical protein